jgi:malonyl CoA-acyl carrier protein transacylase
MGRELFTKYSDLTRLAEKTVGYSIESLCLEESGTRMNSTSFTQPAVFFVSCLALLERRKEPDFAPDIYLGHSLGLYAALFAADAFDLAAGLRIVAKRGQLMEASSEGAMIAVIGDKLDGLEALLMAHDFHDVDLANFNTPNQAVVSGKTARIEEAHDFLQERGFRCARLPVSGPFHSRYMEPARQQFLEFLQTENLRAPALTVVSTTSGEIVRHEYLLEEMAFQLTKPVRWAQTIAACKARWPALTFDEVGPGRILTRLVSEITAETRNSAA